MERLAGLVVPDEQVVAPPFVARVREIPSEERVDVAAWLERRTCQAHARFLGQTAALAVIAVLARSNEVVPCVGSAAMARDDVIERQVVRLRSAVLAGVLVADEDLLPREPDTRARSL